MPDLAVSVVVPTRGGAARLPALLDALATQVLDEAWEVVLVLDGDVDGSRALIEEYADRIPLRVVETDGGPEWQQRWRPAIARPQERSSCGATTT